jgi:hypothetical protein
VINIRNRKAYVLAALAIVLAALMLLASSCISDPDRDRRRPDPGYNPDRNGGLWLNHPAALGVSRRPLPAPSVVVHAGHGGTYGTSGDSTMSDTYLPPEQRAPYLLARRVCGAVCGTAGNGDVIDVSRGGQRLIDGVDHNLVDDWPGILAARSWTTIFVLIGTDDLYGSPSADWEAAYLQIYNQAAAAGARVVPCLILPLVQNKRQLYLREPQREELNRWIRTTFPSYVDTEAALAEPGGIGLSPAYDSGDGMHLNAAGVVVLANALYARI